MLRIDRHDLPQEFFALGFVVCHGAQPQPGRFIARLGNDDEVEQLAGFVFQSALRCEYALAEQFVGVHEYFGNLTGRFAQNLSGFTYRLIVMNAAGPLRLLIAWTRPMI